MNLREKFQDFDKLRKLNCHKQKASSTLKINIPELLDSEVERILTHFQLEFDNNYFCYDNFANTIAQTKVLQ